MAVAGGCWNANECASSCSGNVAGARRVPWKAPFKNDQSASRTKFMTIEPHTDTSDASPGQSDRRERLIHIYDQLDDVGKQELLRLAEQLSVSGSRSSSKAPLAQSWGQRVDFLSVPRWGP